MKPSTIVGSASLAIVAAVDSVGVALAPRDGQPLLLICMLVALSATVRSVRGERAELMPALLLSLPPVVALAGGAMAWAIGPLAVLLLIATELNELSWDLRGAVPGTRFAQTRLANIARLGVIALVGTLLVGAAGEVPSPGGTLSVVIASIAIVAISFVLFGMGGTRAGRNGTPASRSTSSEVHP